MPTLDQFDAFVRSGLKIRHLRLLVALDDHRVIARVANALNITQPAVSKTLAELEKGLGLKLFDRNPRGISPTAFGESLVRHARALQAELTLASDDLKELALGTTGKVAIGTLPAAASVLLPRSLALFKSRFPSASVSVREGALDSLLQELELRNLDLVVGTLTPSKGRRNLREQILTEQPLTLIARRRHPLTLKKQLAWGDLEGLPWVLPPVGAPLRDPLESMLVRNGIGMPVNHIEALSIPVIQNYVSLTDAIAFVPSDVANHYHGLGLVSALPLELRGLLRPVGMIWCSDRPLTPIAQSLMKCIDEAAKPAKTPKGRRRR